MRFLRQHWQRIGLSLVPLLLAVLHGIQVLPVGVFQRLEAIVYDARMRASLSDTLDQRIVIVDIDEKSLTELGRWPWGRHKMADLVDTLFDRYQIALLGLDVVFAEPDDSSGLKQLGLLAQQALRHDTEFIRQLDKISPLLDHDGRFADALRDRPIVLGYYFTSDRLGHASGVLPAPVLTAQTLAGRQLAATDWDGYGANIRRLAQAAPQAGFFNSITEADGVVRALPLLARHGENYYESLSLAMFRRLLGGASVLPGPDPATSSGSWKSIVIQHQDQTFSIPVDERTAVNVVFSGRGGASGGTFRYISASDVLAGRLPVDQLKGKLVLLGTTAPGSGDVRPTPVGAVYPGIEVQANALANLLDRRFLIQPHHRVTYELALLLLLGMTLMLTLPTLRAPTAMAVSLMVMLALLGFNQWLYQAHQMLMPLVPSLFLVLAIAFLNIGYGYLVASRSRRELVQLFGTYVPPELVLEMVKDPDHYTMRAKSDELTVMFCDMRGFTRMSEQLSPQQLQQLLNSVFNELTRLIGSHRGTVDKYMGDCVMAFWGAPVESPAHAQLAVKAALQMAWVLERINQGQLPGVTLPEDLTISVGIGINTGQMYVGDMGSDIRRSYTVIGDAVNLASRLEGLSKVYGVSIVAGETTRQLAGDFVWQELDRVRVKGKAQAITIYTPLALELTTELAQELALWQQFLNGYRAQDGTRAETLIAELMIMAPDKPLYPLYADRIKSRREQAADPDWDGTTNFESK
ncbi:adenylate/guanylate cyclase domain-containing protein [Rhodoferax sp.]|uniref:CHASE2 domain-containing protein n=1 Tax=Rhodoferax sp. TaxID=50421 RepID=UPI00261A194F|nr:adenylate/guanylate cyclase domain-containing protein [Rhodoferax sp.]MDD2925627.1 adenylate/guanylate cyclase domain-containing protein [Rhodoferax sp.]